MTIRETLLDEIESIEEVKDLKIAKISLWGVAPVAPIHIGYDSLAHLQIQTGKLSDAKHYIIFPDLHALMTHSLSLDDLKKRVIYYEFCNYSGLSYESTKICII